MQTSSNRIYAHWSARESHTLNNYYGKTYLTNSVTHQIFLSIEQQTDDHSSLLAPLVSLHSEDKEQIILSCSLANNYDNNINHTMTEASHGGAQSPSSGAHNHKRASDYPIVRIQVELHVQVLKTLKQLFPYKAAQNSSH